MKSAYTELMEILEPEESVEAIVFGSWGGGEGWEVYGEPKPPPVPKNKRWIVLSLDEAKPFMQGWSFYGDLGSPDCYAVTIYTDRRIFFVSEYDGSTSLASVPRNPTPHHPNLI